MKLPFLTAVAAALAVTAVAIVQSLVADRRGAVVSRRCGGGLQQRCRGRTRRHVFCLITGTLARAARHRRTSRRGGQLL